MINTITEPHDPDVNDTDAIPAEEVFVQAYSEINTVSTVLNDMYGLVENVNVPTRCGDIFFDSI